MIRVHVFTVTMELDEQDAPTPDAIEETLQQTLSGGEEVGPENPYGVRSLDIKHHAIE